MTHFMSNYTAPESILVGRLHQMPSQVVQWYLEERLAVDGIDWHFQNEIVVFRQPTGDVQGRFGAVSNPQRPDDSGIGWDLDSPKVRKEGPRLTVTRCRKTGKHNA
jgi:hypothetical protein